MGSMSYCLFENTSSELERCVEKMEEAGSLAELTSEMSEYEERAFYAMFRIARSFLAEYERLMVVQLRRENEEVDLSDECFE